MHPTANLLVQLQELTLIRDEQKVAERPERLQPLDTSIKTMLGRLPKDIRVMFEKLRKKDHIVIAPIANRLCSVCGMTLPISLVQSVQQAKKIYNCPSCSRLLFYPQNTARRVAAPLLRGETRKVGVSRFSAPALMIPRLQAEDKEGVIGELAMQMEQEGFVDNGEMLLESALRRETIVSTAMSHGLAFPHVRGIEGGALTFSLGLSPKGIVFDENGSGLMHIIFFIVIPTAASAFYLKLLSGLAETFSKAEARKALLAAKDNPTLWKTLCKLTRSTIK